MIGSRRMAYPRLEALSFWITPAAFIVLLSGIIVGGFPTGWTGYAPLSIEAGEGQDAYLVAFGLMALSMIVGGFNIICTIINYRAPGMTWTRVPHLRLVDARHGDADGARGTRVGRRDLHVTVGPHRADGPVRRAARRQLVPVGELVLVLRAPRGLHPRASRFRHCTGVAHGFRAQAALRLPNRGRRHGRRRHAVILRLAASPVRQRHEPRHAAGGHADDRADLDPDGHHLPRRGRHVVACAIAADRARSCSCLGCSSTS